MQACQAPFANRNILVDKGDVDGEREERLSKQGWRMHIQRKGRKGRPISAAQERRNKRIAKSRAPIEHVFAAWVNDVNVVWIAKYYQMKQFQLMQETNR